MGLCVSNFVFERDIPLFLKIQNQFRIQTELHLGFSANIKVAKLSSDIDQVQNSLIQDYSKVLILKQKIQADMSNNSLMESLEELNYISTLSLRVWGFEPIEFTIKENMIELESYIGDFYVIESLKKVLYDLGGKRCNLEGEILENWTPPKLWKKLKKWSKYKWYNPPKR